MILQELCAGTSLKAIAAKLGRETSSVSREIKRHIVWKKPSNFNNSFNNCASKASCKITALCAACLSDKQCRTCAVCRTVCKSFKPTSCQRLAASPYVCNGCKDKKPACARLPRAFYQPKDAQERYENTLSDTRSCVVLSKQEFYELSTTLAPKVQKGQSFAHILHSSALPLDVSRRTLYRYVQAGYFTFANIDLPRKVRYKAMRKAKAAPIKDLEHRIGRKYADYLTYIASHRAIAVVQLDSVIGCVGGKCLVTLQFVDHSFMLAFLVDSHSDKSTERVFSQIKVLLGEKYSTLIPVALTDCGTEFSKPSAIEKIDGDGEFTTVLFYCNPYSSWEKAEIENNHALLRRILPKGYSFDALTQDDISLAVSHLNSYCRDSLDGQTPYQSFVGALGRNAADMLGVQYVDPSEVNLTPNLLGKKLTKNR